MDHEGAHPRLKGMERIHIILVTKQVGLEHQKDIPTVEGNPLVQLTNFNVMFGEIVRDMNVSPEKEKKRYC